MRIGLVRPDRIGDCVLASCAIHDVLTARPEARVFWIVREQVAPLFAGSDFPATLVTFRDDEPVEAFASRLEKLKLDAIAFLNPHPLAEEAAALAGVPCRAGFAKTGFSPWLTHSTKLDKDAGQLHEADAGCLVLQEIAGLKITGKSRRRACLAPTDTAASETDALKLPSAYAVFHPAAHGNKTRIPAAIFKTAAQHWTRHNPGYPVILIGEKPAPDDLPADFSPGALDLRGKLSLAASALLMRHASLVLSRDSGPAHIAAALGAPTVCVFPDLSPWAGPVRWMPVGPRVEPVVTPATPRWYERIHYAAYRRRAAAAVRPEAVIAAMDALKARP